MDDMPTMAGRFAVFNEWTEIDSVWEGRFMERIAPGAFLRTFAEDRDRMRVLFNHGRDPHIGDKVLGPLVTLREDERGAYYEVPLLDTSYNRDLLPGLQAGQYGASFRFTVDHDEVDERPPPSAFNPQGLPERTIRQARVYELGPVTWPAYQGATAAATAGMRCRSDGIRLLPPV
jgi:HK97 family phage prohead protease